jgi:hypothetical protein
MRNYSDVRFYVDDFGRVWKGPCCPDDTLHYGTFCGFVKGCGEEIWVFYRSASDPTWEEIPEDAARRAMERFRGVYEEGNRAGH